MRRMALVLAAVGILAAGIAAAPAQAEEGWRGDHRRIEHLWRGDHWRQDHHRRFAAFEYRMAPWHFFRMFHD